MRASFPTLRAAGAAAVLAAIAAAGCAALPAARKALPAPLATAPHDGRRGMRQRR